MSRYVRIQQDMRGFLTRGPHMMGLDLYEQICEDPARYERISHERATYDGIRLV